MAEFLFELPFEQSSAHFFHISLDYMAFNNCLYCCEA